MLQRFTPAARAVVVAAQEHARRLGQRQIGTEHVLRALLDGDGTAARALRSRGLTAASVDAGIADPRGDERDADRRALASIGIDLDAVLASVGDLPLQGAPPARRARWRRALRRMCHPGRRARAGGPLPGPAHIPWGQRSKRCLELALREAIRLRDRSIEPEHLLLGILREGRGTACRILAAHGVSVADLRTELERSDGRAA